MANPAMEVSVGENPLIWIQILNLDLDSFDPKSLKSFVKKKKNERKNK